MKTTIDIEDELLIEAKATAARRRTTLKAMVEHALRREVGPTETINSEQKDFASLIGRDEHGFPYLKKRGGPPLTSEMVYKLLEDSEQEDDMRRAYVST